MQQAGYTPEEIDKMTAAFTKANPTITVENTYVAYEALHDKIVISAPAGTYDVVLIDCIWPTEPGQQEHDRRRHQPVPRGVEGRHPARHAGHRLLPGQVLRRPVVPGRQGLLLQQDPPAAGRRRPGADRHVGRLRRRSPHPEAAGRREVPVHVEPGRRPRR
ncbi:hypothetical protein GCM10025868_29470 [Angustibacter aerolatus]|uniref:PABS domain-containing protein n=1 Tax=Angustibacter aerolatus TaxID=1162965 RepID=A0ABQ6JIW1_9ACTN|nr:extracellular solute-binding protein [Angustibacter aerolatus]GMA87697.1 hypothetical protein GCM10025868_29470 [Angustibacter aerolatus]